MASEEYLEYQKNQFGGSDSEREHRQFIRSLPTSLKKIYNAANDLIKKFPSKSEEYSILVAVLNSFHWRVWSRNWGPVKKQMEAISVEISALYNKQNAIRSACPHTKKINIEKDGSPATSGFLVGGFGQAASQVCEDCGTYFKPDGSVLF